MEEKEYRRKLGTLVADIRYIWWQELKAVFRDQGVIVFFVVVPLVYPVLYAFIYMQETVHDSKMVVVDDDNTALSRTYLRMIDASPGVSIVADCPNLSSANDFLLSKDAYGILVLPKGFASDIALGRQTTVALYSDLSSILYYKNFMLTANEVALEMGRDYQKRHNVPGTERVVSVSVRPVSNQDVAYFNPGSGYSSFLVPPILMLIIQQTMLLGVCMLAGTNRERNALHTLIPIARKHYKGAVRIVCGKSFAYLTVYVPIVVYVLVLVPFFFTLPQLYSPWSLLLFIIPYLLACTFFSLAISCITRSRESAMMILVFTSVIFIFLTGITWPMSAMSEFWRSLAMLIPSTPGARGFVSLSSMGANFHDVVPLYRTLWIQTAGYALLAVVGYFLQMKTSRRLLMQRLSAKRAARRRSKASYHSRQTEG